MLKSGYTSVAEFHYLHRRPGRRCLCRRQSSVGGHRQRRGRRGHRPHVLADSVPVQRFRRPAAEARAGAIRFGHGGFCAPSKSASPRSRSAPSGARQPHALRTGAAFHSLRAVPLDTLREAALALASTSMPSMPVHIHVAEQVLEVTGLRARDRPPPHRTAARYRIARRRIGVWCMPRTPPPRNSQGLAAAAATVCVSISTEANLGRRLLRCRPLSQGGRPPLRGLRQPVHRQSRRGAALAGISAAPAQEAPRRAGRRSPNRTSGLACGVMPRSTGRRPSANRSDRSRWAAAPTGWCWMPAHPSMVGAAPDTALDHLLFAGGDCGDPRLHGRRPLGDQGSAPRGG